MNICMQKKNKKKSYFDQINTNIQKLLILVLKSTRYQIFNILNDYFKSFQNEIKIKKIM